MRARPTNLWLDLLQEGKRQGVAESLTWLSALPSPLRHISTFSLTQCAAFPVSPRLSPLTIIRPML
jgi:hypothetical protein